TAAIYAAITLAAPGGLGPVDKADIHEAPPNQPPAAMMALAADRDRIAAEWTSGFTGVLETIRPALTDAVRAGDPLDTAIVQVQLQQLADHSDTLVAGKTDAATDTELRRLATVAIEAGGPGTPAGETAIAELDRWLRADGNRRNPGTTADLIGAALFAAIIDGQLSPPWPWAGPLAV
ncbi:MAG: triphosphoribosyl-dephospho-CoA synthase, partial [Phycisphaeraceae bacterium]|nr:triphosphoribosyl-dephospho-CoA synthase [Phycisphaeraceae bacterium]